MRYATRNHALTPPTTWVIDGPWLVVEEQDAAPTPPRSWALSEVAQVRLEFAPTRPEPNRYRCRITFRSGEMREFFNRTCAGLMDFQDTSAAFVAFVRALHAALARPELRALGPRFVAGASGWSYVGNMAAIVFVFAGLVTLAFLLLSLRLTWLVVVKLVIVLASLPTLIQWAARNRPREYAPGQIPADVLPLPDRK